MACHAPKTFVLDTNVILHDSTCMYHFGNNHVVTPLSYIRGRSIVKVFFIIDEAQNLTPHEIKTIITRAGEGTKVVFTGDIFKSTVPIWTASPTVSAI